MNRIYIFVLCFFFAAPAALQAQAQQQPEQNETFSSSHSRLGTRLGYLLQEQFYYYPDAAPGNQVGFRLPTVRARLHSFWDATYELFVQVDFVRPISVLDAVLTVPVADDLEIEAGLFKSPFSREFLLFPEDLPFIERSQVVQALAPNRQVGVSLQAFLLEDRLTVEVGAFNGNGATLDANENDRFMFIGRLNWTAPLPSGTAQVGVNAGYSEDTGLNLPIIGTSNGERILLGADGEVVLERWLLRAEFIAASFGAGSSIDTAYGYVGTVGVKLVDSHHFYASYDVLDRGRSTDEYAVFGYKVYLGEVVTLLANYQLPLDDPKRSEAVLRIQFAVR